MGDVVQIRDAAPAADADPPAQHRNDALLRAVAVAFDLADKNCLTKIDAAFFLIMNLQRAGYLIVPVEDLPRGAS